MHYSNCNWRILIVSESTTESDDLVTMLRDLGMDCGVAANATEAKAAMEASFGHGVLPGLIICDAQLPDASGNDFAAGLQIDPRFKAIPIIVAAAKYPRAETQNADIDQNKSDLMHSISGALATQSGIADQCARAAKPVNRSVDILVAEDNDINQLVLTHFLESTPWSFMIVENGRRAVHAFRHTNPRLVLMDISMPEMDGREATSVIRALENMSGTHVPIIALTAHALNGDREACIDAGMDEYLAKPLNFDQLSMLMNKYLVESTSARSAA